MPPHFWSWPSNMVSMLDVKKSQVTPTSSDIGLVICLPLRTEDQEIDMTLEKKKPINYHSID